MNIFLPLLDWSAFRRNDEDPQGIHNYSRADLAPRKRPPCFLILAGVPAGGAVARTLTPTGARQLIVCTVSVYFRVAGDANSLTPNNQTHTLRVRATRAKHDKWLFYLKKPLPSITKGFCVWAFSQEKALYAQKPPLIVNR